MLSVQNIIKIFKDHKVCVVENSYQSICALCNNYIMQFISDDSHTTFALHIDEFINIDKATEVILNYINQEYYGFRKSNRKLTEKQDFINIGFMDFEHYKYVDTSSQSYIRIDNMRGLLCAIQTILENVEKINKYFCEECGGEIPKTEMKLCWACSKGI